VFGGNSMLTSGISGLITAANASTQSLTVSGGQTLMLSVFQGASALNGVLNCLRQNDLLKIVAEPNLVCVSGRPAFFNVGGEFPILVPQSLGTVSIQYKKFGTQLDFVPIVLGNNRIRLEVRPRVSEVDPTRSITINGTTVPGLRVREVETGVELRAGETLAIAGLVQQRIDAQKRGIPWLGDMPGIGFIFRSTREQLTEIETLILVTPQFVEGMECHEVPPYGPGLETVSPTHCQLWCQGQLEVPCGRIGMDTHRPGCDPPPCGAMPGAMIDSGDLIGPPPTGPSPEVIPRPTAPPATPPSSPEPQQSTSATPPRLQPKASRGGTARPVSVRAAEPIAEKPLREVGAGRAREGKTAAVATATPDGTPVRLRFQPENLFSPQNRATKAANARLIPAPGLIGPAGYDVHN
jgi:pilus assembly protein CpaC